MSLNTQAVNLCAENKYTNPLEYDINSMYYQIKLNKCNLTGTEPIKNILIEKYKLREEICQKIIDNINNANIQILITSCQQLSGYISILETKHRRAVYYEKFVNDIIKEQYKSLYHKEYIYICTKMRFNRKNDTNEDEKIQLNKIIDDIRIKYISSNMCFFEYINSIEQIKKENFSFVNNKRKYNEDYKNNKKQKT